MWSTGVEPGRLVVQMMRTWQPFPNAGTVTVKKLLELGAVCLLAARVGR